MVGFDQAFGGAIRQLLAKGHSVEALCQLKKTKIMEWLSSTGRVALKVRTSGSNRAGILKKLRSQVLNCVL